MKKIIILIIVIAIAVGGFYLYTQYGDSPAGVFKEYMEKINSEDYENMYEMITSSSKEKISKEDFIKRNRNIYSRSRFKSY